MSNLLERGFQIRYATDVDVPSVVALIRAQEKRFAGSLGAPHYPSLRKAVTEKRLHVAELNDVGIVGYVEYWRRRDGVQTIYGLATDPRFEGLGIGRNLLYSVECPIRLKCPQLVNVDKANPANAFYAKAGLKLSGIDATRGGKTLNIWTLNILPVLIQGGNPKIPELARATGWAYGTRSSEKPRDWCYQVDLKFSEDWRAFNWAQYLNKVQRWKPVAALALDYFEPEQLPTLLTQIEDLKAVGVLRVLVCPKFDGAVKDIPLDCVVAVSVPSTYAGFVPDFTELKGRKVHLLGGSPPKWFGSKRGQKNRVGIIEKIRHGGGKVISVDGNAHTKVAALGGIWLEGRWFFKVKPLDLYEFARRSGLNILEDLHKYSNGELVNE